MGELAKTEGIDKANLALTRMTKGKNKKRFERYLHFRDLV